MQNSNFEKQIHRKMEELKLFPSAGVWDKLEAALPKEKKRRRLIFFLLFAALSTGTFVWLNKDHDQVKNISQLEQPGNKIAANEGKINNNAEPQKNEINNSTGPGTTKAENNLISLAKKQSSLPSSKTSFTRANNDDMSAVVN